MRALVQDLARHEAGHYVVGRVLGFTMEGCSLGLLDFQGAHNAACTVLPQRPLTTLAEVVDYAKKRATMLNAGSLAQATRGGIVDNDDARRIADAGGANDRAKVRELEHLIRNIECPNAQTEAEIQAKLTELDLELWRAAAGFVDGSSAVIEVMGQVFAAKITHDRQVFTLSVAEIEVIPEVRAKFGLPPVEQGAHP